MKTVVSDDPVNESVILLGEQGLEGLSLRALASRLGVSASSLIYKYGSRDGLLVDLLQELVAQKSSILDAASIRFGEAELAAADIPALARAYLTEQTTQRRLLHLALWEYELIARPEDELYKLLCVWRANDAEFWAVCLKRAGLRSDLADVWSSGVVAISRLLLIGEPNAVRLAWVEDVINRLFDRLFAQTVRREGDSLWRHMSEVDLTTLSALPEEGTTAQKIIRAACDVILSNGCAGVSHRTIAKAAGVSLSSMTHHFATLDDIFFAAFAMIYRDASEKAQSASAPHSYSKRRFVDDILPGLTRQNSGGQEAAHAMESIIRRASRSSVMQETAIGLFALMGMTSTRMLMAINDVQGLDRLDGHVFRMVTTGNRLLAERYDAYAPDNPNIRFLEAYL